MWVQEDCHKEENLADKLQNKRLRTPPQENLGTVRRGRTCPEVQERQHAEQDATCNECSSPELVGPLHFRRHGDSWLLVVSVQRQPELPCSFGNGEG